MTAYSQQIKFLPGRQQIFHSWPFRRACSRSAKLMQASLCPRLIAAFTLHFSLKITIFAPLERLF
jgi:hypothetical protein